MEKAVRKVSVASLAFHSTQLVITPQIRGVVSQLYLEAGRKGSAVDAAMCEDGMALSY
jgi:hypothetical protein